MKETTEIPRDQRTHPAIYEILNNFRGRISALEDEIKILQLAHDIDIHKEEERRGAPPALRTE